MMANEWIAACGLDCGSCDIRRIPFDEKAADGCAKWFRDMGWLKPEEDTAEIIERGMYCKGCKGDRSVHWSVNANGSVSCSILACCVDQKKIEFCSQCEEFPCGRLIEWSKENDGYAAAFSRLQAMHGKSGDTSLNSAA